VGNFGYDSRQSDLERLFGKYGKIERVDMKSGLFDFDVVAFYRP
jgi:arginine/serine-rich splicing factor 4/5/6